MQKHIATTGTLAEFVVDDRLEALNAALSARGVSGTDVVAVLAIPEIVPAIGDWRAKLRVLYRASA